MVPTRTAESLLTAAEAVIGRAQDTTDVTSRAIAAEAGVTLSAIAYHFGSLDGLVAQVGRRVYQRLNRERLALLQEAIDRHRPDPPSVACVIEALIGPSIRWSLDPASPYKTFAFMRHRSVLSPTPELFRQMVDEVDHHRAFIGVLRRCAPWLTDAEVGWRVNAALGIRSQVTQQPRRAGMLTDFTIDLSDPDTVIAAIVEIVTPMFDRPVGAPRSAVRAAPRRPGTAT
jgi:AcrR family transcriptional regulator